LAAVYLLDQAWEIYMAAEAGAKRGVAASTVAAVPGAPARAASNCPSATQSPPSDFIQQLFCY